MQNEYCIVMNLNNICSDIRTRDKPTDILIYKYPIWISDGSMYAAIVGGKGGGLFYFTELKALNKNIVKNY